MQSKLRSTLQLILKISLVVAMIPMIQAQESPPQTSPNTSVSPSIEEIQVFGIRRSLESALEEKRFTTNLTEIINADDIGKLPDENAVFVGFYDGSVLFSEIDETKKSYPIRSQTGYEVSVISISSDKKYILIGDIKGNVLCSPLWAGEL